MSKNLPIKFDIHDGSVATREQPANIPRTPRNPYQRLFQTVLMKQVCYINDLWELVGYETMSMREEARPDMQRAVDWLLKRLLALDVVAFAEHMGMQLMPDSFTTIPMPRCIIGVITHNRNRPTILVYGNLDVDDAKEKGWHTDPFVLLELNEHLYGRGVAQDKGPLLCWLNAMQSYRDAGMRLPVNLVFLIEGMAHSGSLGLETVLQQRISFFREVSCVVIATRRWANNTRPGIVYGSRGLVYYHLEVQCANRDLSCCEHGGSLFEALPDLFYLLSSLVDCHANILVDGIVQPYEIDLNVLRCADFDYRQFGRNIETFSLPNQQSNFHALHSCWAMPHLTIHGIEGASAEEDVRFIIPHRVVGKFSIALAPNQNAGQVTLALHQHLGQVWRKRGSPNQMVLCEKFSIPSWHGDCHSPEYNAAVRAMQQTYEKRPNYIRDGGALLAPSIFQTILHKNVLVLPIAKNDDGGGPVNERLSVENYIKGTQLLASFMWEYGEAPKKNAEQSVVPPHCMPHV